MDKVSKQSKSDSSSLGFREFVGVALSLSAFVVALFYFTGHTFMLHFFQEMNISYHLYTMSLWEYGEIGWSYIIISLFKSALYGLLATTIIGFAILGMNLFGSWISRRFPRLVKTVRKLPSRFALSELSLVWLKRLLMILQALFWVVVSIAIVVLIIGAASHDARIGGMQAGHDALLNAQYLTLITSQPLDIPGGTIVTPVPDQELYRYDGLYLLIYNEGRYFVYRDLGVEICRPKEVFIIDSKQIEQAILSARPASAPSCP